MKRASTTLLLIVLAFFLTALSGCQSTEALYRGKTVPPEHVIPLPGSVSNERWETFDLIIEYSYSEDGNNFQISGQVDLSSHYREIYEYLDRLDVYLLFLESRSSVIKTVKLANGYTADTKDSIPFIGHFSIPQNAVAFSFAYYGTAREIDGKRGNVSTFMHVPKYIPPETVK